MGSFAAGAGTKFLVTSVSPVVSGSFTITGGTATANTPALNVTQTWNNAAVTFTGWQFNVTDTASNAASLLMDLQVGGSTRFNVRKDGTVNLSTNAPYINVPSGFGALQLGGTNVFIWQSGAVRVNGVDLQIGATDTVLTRDAANTLAQRNGTNAQTFNIYNTFTDASNYERGRVAWESNAFVIGAQSVGTGSNRTTYLTSSGNTSAAQVRIGTDASGGRIWFTPANVNAWEMNISGHFVAGVDNTYDIGASGASRPRTVFAGTSVLAPYVRTSTAYTVATLPAAGTAGAGARAYVTDANATTFASIVAGGGANIVPVMSNGTNWIIG